MYYLCNRGRSPTWAFSFCMWVTAWWWSDFSV